MEPVPYVTVLWMLGTFGFTMSSVIFVLAFQNRNLCKIINEQQKTIDDLKRELEEMKQKQ